MKTEVPDKLMSEIIDIIDDQEHKDDLAMALGVFITNYTKEACKEQRHICQVEMNAKYSIQDEEDRWYISCEDILNAPEPKL